MTRLATLSEHLRLSRLIHEFETNGHFAATVDPLRLDRNVVHGKHLRSTSLLKEYHGFSDLDLGKTFDTSEEPVLRKRFSALPATLGEILGELETTFSGSVGVEFRHMNNPAKVEWVRNRVLLRSSGEDEARAAPCKERVLAELCSAQAFEEFCSNKFSAATHFSLEGGESLIPGLEALLEHCAVRHDMLGVEMGMAHRGRLNVLRNILKIPIHRLLDRFEAYLEDDDESLPNNSDDVRYHLGANVRREFDAGKAISINLAANPSHLEAVNGVVLGCARAKQFKLGADWPEARRKIMPLLLHGDASFFQGSVRECLGFSNLDSYTTGGTVHVIVNNQIGFTTLPRQAHSSTYCSDVAKSVGAPVFHVNADAPLEVIRVFQDAVDFRQAFLSDVVVNLWCYRRRGHNQKDSPQITQPLMYREIHRHLPVTNQFANEMGVDLEPFMLAASRAIESNQLVLARAQSARSMETAEDQVRVDWHQPQQNPPAQLLVGVSTGVDKSTLVQLGQTLFTLPAHFENVHPKIKQVFDKRLESLRDRVRWDVAEQLAFASLMQLEKIDVRLSGQDCERGTFNQRNAVLNAVVNDHEVHYSPFSQLPTAGGGSITVCNSPLSEESVLAFEHGYSLVDCFQNLTMWEAQFGDFANCCQTIIDTFIASGEDKWIRPSGIVLLLPHGLDGQGPDHSSAYVERFLALSNERDDPARPFAREELARQGVNLHIANPTTPAQYFHLLRRHVLCPFRKPLIVFSPKYLLHHRPCTSALDDFAPGTKFQVVLPEPCRTAKRIVLCTGKMYFHLCEERDRRKLGADVALIRVEQLCPFPFNEIAKALEARAAGAEVLWVQEEPKNRGAWTWMQPRLSHVLQGSSDSVRYMGRPPSASAATGSYPKHKQELQRLIHQVLTL